MSILFCNNIAMEPLKIPQSSKEIMIKQSLNELPDECCGLLLGKNGKIRRTLPMKNIDPSPDSYFMDPLQQVEIFTEMEKRGEQLIGIYHSHPKGPSIPSGADLKMAFHQDTLYIIISLENRNSPEMSAFILEKGSFKEIKLI
jgi:proteasome lid subunit RPN8/RPN11